MKKGLIVILVLGAMVGVLSYLSVTMEAETAANLVVQGMDALTAGGSFVVGCVMDAWEYVQDVHNNVGPTKSGL